MDCAAQAEVDWYWEQLSSGGVPGRRGWLKDKFGVSCQIVPAAPRELMAGGPPGPAGRVMAALLKMGKPDIETLRRACHVNPL